MKPERWQQVDQIFQAALERLPAERAVFIGAACGDDDLLRLEVEKLLAADAQAENLIETPAYAVAAPLLVGNDAPSLVGQSIGHYRIVSLLGKGGMGEVYRACDIKLDRPVALKILPVEVATDQERMRRFIREAKAASALNHPHVATIYEIGEVDGLSFIAMEYVEGQTLAARINGQPLAASEIVEIGSQIANALGEAHGKGITHRDIKPANVMLNERGQVKVLDFGLAKMARPAEQPVGSDISTLAKTASGVVMGTVPYMSPEQALGHEVDRRSDLFSLGIVLYEMATGRLPFAGANTIETLDRLLHAQPETLAQFNRDIPAELEHIVRKCLEKERERRYQSAHDLLNELGNLKRTLESGSSQAVRRTSAGAELRALKRLFPRRRWALVALCAALALVVVFGGLQVWRRGAGGPRPLSSIAILPFKSLAGNADQDYVADGITDSLISEFQKIKALKKVIGSASVMLLKDIKKPLPELAKDLDVEAILEGMTLRDGARVGVSVKLLEAPTGRVRWTQRYDLELKDAWSLYGEVARKVAGEIQLELSPAELASLSQVRSVSPEIQDALWKGRSYRSQKWRNPASLFNALAAFQEAAKLDPKNAEALAGVAESYALLGNYGMLPQAEAFPKSQDAALRALELDERSAEAHRALIFWHYTWHHDWPLAEREIKRSLDFAPNDTQALSIYADWLMLMGRSDEAVSVAKRVHELAPLDLELALSFGRIYYYARRYDEAVRVFKTILDLDEKHATAAMQLSLIYLAMKRYDEAWRWRLKVISSFPGFSEDDRQRFVEAWRVGGWPVEWREELAWWNRSGAPLDFKSGMKAFLYSLLGEKDQAFSELEVAFREHSPWLFQLSDPGFDALRSDPRFKNLRHRLNLPPE